MNFRTFSFMFFVFASFVSSATSQSAREPMLIACEINVFDACIEEKITSIRNDIEDPYDLVEVYSVYEAHCQKGGADACFVYGSLLLGSSDLVGALAAQGWDKNLIAAQIDKLEAERIYLRSCELGSAMGCATFAHERLENTGLLIDELAQATQSEILGAQLKACRLGWVLACEVYAEIADDVDGDTWPDGPEAFNDHYMEAAKLACTGGSDIGCITEAVEYLMFGQRMGGAAKEIDYGIKLLRTTCDSGSDDACHVYRLALEETNASQ